MSSTIPAPCPEYLAPPLFPRGISQVSELDNYADIHQSIQPSDHEVGCTAPFAFMANPFKRLWETRAGLVEASGQVLLPSSQKSPSVQFCKEQCSNLAKDYQWQTLETERGANGVLLWPENGQKDIRDRCIVYCHANGEMLHHFISPGGKLRKAAGTILQLRERAMLLFDYRGSGLSQHPKEAESKYKPTQASIVQDAADVIQLALDQFDEVEVWGTSLGGGAGAKAVCTLLEKNPGLVSKVSLVCHDTFTSTMRTLAPNWPWVADTLGKLVGAHLSTLECVNELATKGLKITVLNHKQDPRLTQGSRLSEGFGDDYPPNMLIYESPQAAHAVLSDDMLEFLRQNPA